MKIFVLDKYGLSSLAGLLSVLCRQTNIVWVFFMAGLAGGQILAEQIRLHQVYPYIRATGCLPVAKDLAIRR